MATFGKSAEEPLPYKDIQCNGLPRETNKR